MLRSGVLQPCLSDSKICQGKVSLVATKELKFRTCNNYSYEKDWINSPDRSRRKERKAILLRLQRSTRHESTLTFPPGFSIRGLLRHAAARLQYTGVHRCSCGTEDRGFRLWGVLLLGGAHSLPQNCLQH